MSDSKNNNPKFHHYTVYGTYAGTRGYREHLKLGIVARSILDALNIAQQLHGPATFHNIAHTGIVDIIDSRAEVLIIADVGDDGMTMA